MQLGNGPITSVLDISRRRWIAAAATLAGGLAIGSKSVLAADENGLSHSADAIHQELIFKVTPERVYDALVDERQFQKVELLSDAVKSLDIVGKPAKISREPGGAFSIFADYIVGRQIELVPNQRLVQVWRVTSWDPGAYSLARFELRQQSTGTQLIFDHTGFPAGTGAHLASGWHAHYWEPLEKFLA